MTQDSFNELFNAPEPDADARRKHLALAMAEFEAAHAEKHEASTVAAPAGKKTSGFFQGFINWWRPTGDNNPQRDNTMTSFQKKFLISGLATSTLVVAGLVVFNEQLLPQGGLSDDGRPLIVTREAVVEAPAVKRQEFREESAKPGPRARDQVLMESEALVAAAPSASYHTRGIVPPRDIMPLPPREYRDRFEGFSENTVKSVADEPVSTFSIDVDTASYSFVRRSLNQGQLPPKDAVRVEELINYFDYDYTVPRDKSAPFAPNVLVTDSPWKAGNKLIHIGIKGYQLPANDVPRSNLVFLLDVSGSMNSPDRLPLVQQAMELLLDQLQPEDTIAVVVYAGAAGTVLEPTPVKEKERIRKAIRSLTAGGSTAGAQGIQLAYELAEANFDPKAVNRIFLATDGDFNVGPTGDNDLKTLVERKRQAGIYLSVLGFGMGNYQDAMMQTLAQNGNGVAVYIDTLSEAHKVLVHEAQAALFPIAQDVKIQVEFNPATVAEYRLIGYETRALNREDFNNDKVDAGDIGAGHSVTAIYEVTPAGGKTLLEPSRYQQASSAATEAKSGEYGFLRIRYKLPGEGESRLIESLLFTNAGQQDTGLQQEARFATAVAAFGQLLRGSVHLGDYSYDQVISLAQSAKGEDEFGYRGEFIQLVRKAGLAKPL